MQSLVVKVLVLHAVVAETARNLEMEVHYWFPSSSDDEMCEGDPDEIVRFTSETCTSEPQRVSSLSTTARTTAANRGEDLVSHRQSFAVRMFAFPSGSQAYPQDQEGDPNFMWLMAYDSNNCGGFAVDELINDTWWGGRDWDCSQVQVSGDSNSPCEIRAEEELTELGGETLYEGQFSAISICTRQNAPHPLIETRYVIVGSEASTTAADDGDSSSDSATSVTKLAPFMILLGLVPAFWEA